MSEDLFFPIVIQCATPQEFHSLHSACQMPAFQEIHKRRFFIGPGNIVVIRGAVGKVWAAASTEFSINYWKPHYFVDFGAAGSLVSELQIGDVILANRVTEHDVGDFQGRLPVLRTLIPKTDLCDRIPVYPEVCEVVPGQIRATRGVIAAGDQDVWEPEQRKRLAAAHSAIAVSWETSAVGRVCNFHGVPFFSIRVITDIGKHRDGKFLEEYYTEATRVLPVAAKVTIEILGALLKV